MDIKNIFFDLDGTIIDSTKGIFNSIKYVISSYNLKELSKNELEKFIGPPLHQIFGKAFGVDFDTSDKYVSKYREYYSKKGVYEFLLYDGIKEMLNAIYNDYNLFITTSKPTHYAKMILEKEDILKYFKFVSGSEKDKPDSSKSQVLEAAIKEYNLDKKECILIGDTHFDKDGANEVMIPFIGVTYGFGKKDELYGKNTIEILNSPKDILNYFKR